MINMPIDAAVLDAEGNRGAERMIVIAAVHRRLRRMAVRIRAAGELSCIDERLREDAGLTRDSYLNAAR